MISTALNDSLSLLAERGARPLHLNLTAEQYHGEQDHESNTTLKLFRKSPKLYHHQRVTRRMPPKPTSDEQRLGNVSHTAILEPDRFDELVAIIPPEVLTKDGKRFGGKWDEWKSANEGRWPILQREADALQWQIDAVWDHPEAARLLRSAGLFEQSLFWTTAEGHRVKARFDAADPMAGVVIDLKTAADPGANWWKAVRDFDYHAQAALYSDGYEAVYSVKPVPLYIVVGNAAPYDCHVYELPKRALDLGRNINLQTLSDIASCRAGKRPWLPEGGAAVEVLDLPPFFYPYTDSYPED